MKYVSPLYLLIVFIAFSVNNLPSWLQRVADEPMAQAARGLIVATSLLLILCVRVGEKRWRAAGLDLDGRRAAEDRA
jgi:hypothetical protein